MESSDLRSEDGFGEKGSASHIGKAGLNGKVSHNGNVVFAEIKSRDSIDAEYCQKARAVTRVDGDQNYCKRCVTYCRNYVVVVIERRGMFRECLVRSIREYLPDEILSFANVAEWQRSRSPTQASIVLLSIGPERLAEDVARSELALLSAEVPDVPVIVLSDQDDLSEAVEAIGKGAKGYISTKSDFAIVMEAIHLVQVGGTYVPAECLLSTKHLGALAAARPSNGAFTSRELAVIQAIRQGKSNKIIAYDLNMCESTVKVHVRHIMKKLHAHNRTEVAIKSASLSGCLD